MGYYFEGDHLDSGGNRIRVGARVAFNRSGDVVLGEVIEIGGVRDNSWRGYGRHQPCNIKIKTPDGVSTVKNPDGIRVIYYEDQFPDRTPKREPWAPDWKPIDLIGELGKAVFGSAPKFGPGD